MDTIIDFSDDYMSYMARHYPVMCLSDEFYFMPRSRAASGFLALVDSLDSEKIKDTEAYVKNLKENLDRLAYDALDIESQIDITVLEQSMSAFLTEFEAVKIWQKDPAVYLKISLLGIDHIISRFLALGNGFENSLLARLSQIPRLLNEGVRNLKNVPATYLKAAIKMADRSAAYLRNLRFSDYCAGKAFLKEAELLSKKAHESIRLFKRFLNQITPRGKYVKDRTILERILKESLFCKMSPEEIYDIAVTEYENTLREMAAVASSCPGNIPWKKILFSYSIHAGNEKQLLRLYSSQIEKIRCFLEEKDIITLPPLHKVTVSSTPEFMVPIRASASYSAPITDNPREKAYFYVTTPSGKGAGSAFCDKKTLSSIHKEYMFIVAHETYPGHHLLDSARRDLKNSLRRQIESPLFYEGWASYAERLIDRLGYVKDPAHKLAGLRRQAWRAIRAMLDAGTAISKLKPDAAEGLIRALGYESRVAKSMVSNYMLTPGYQLCYTIGKVEIDRLRDKYSPLMGLKKFHDTLLGGGEIPFEMVNKRMDKACRKNS